MNGNRIYNLADFTDKETKEQITICPRSYSEEMPELEFKPWQATPELLHLVDKETTLHQEYK